MRKYSKWRKTSSRNIPAFVKHNEKELTKTSLLVVFVYFFCVVSYMVILSIISFSRNSLMDEENKKVLAKISTLIFKQIFWLNNFMYMLRIGAYRKAYFEIYEILKFWESCTSTSECVKEKQGAKESIYAITMNKLEASY